MSIQFKDYNGNPIEVPKHSHVVSDTQKNKTTAFVSTSNIGFVRKEDISKIDYLKTQAEFIDGKLKEIVYIKE